MLLYFLRSVPTLNLQDKFYPEDGGHHRFLWKYGMYLPNPNGIPDDLNFTTTARTPHLIGVGGKENMLLALSVKMLYQVVVVMTMMWYIYISISTWNGLKHIMAAQFQWSCIGGWCHCSKDINANNWQANRETARIYKSKCKTVACNQNPKHC